MSRLSDLINEAIGEALQVGDLVVHDAAMAVVAKLEADDRETLVLEATIARIKAASTKTRHTVLSSARETQAELFFGLPPAVAIDDKIRLTRDLSRLDVEKVIKLRRVGIADDLKSVERWEAARDAAAATMSTHPDWTFGQALDAAMSEASAA